MSRSTWVEAAHGTTLAVLTGVVVIDPTARMRSAPDWSDWLTGQQRVDRVMARVAPPLFLSSAATAAGAALIAVGRRQTGVAVGRGVAAGCVAAAVAVTLLVNDPVNARLRTWRPEDAPPADWRAARARWDQGHRWRQGLVVAAASAALWGHSRRDGG